MIPLLFNENPNDLAYMGLAITESISCEVKEDIEGYFELTLTLRKDGKAFKNIHKDTSIIQAKPNDESDSEWFRVYSISSSTSMIATVKARHISYDLLKMYFDTSIFDIFEDAGAEKDLAVKLNVFYIMRNLARESLPKQEKPLFVIGNVQQEGDPSLTLIKYFHYSGKIENVRKMLFGDKDSVLSVFGGAFIVSSVYQDEEERKKKIPYLKWVLERGQNRGAFVHYGKNMIDYFLDNSAENDNFTHVLGVCDFQQDGETESKELHYIVETALNNEHTTPRVAKIDYTEAIDEIIENEGLTTEEEVFAKLKEFVEIDAAKDFSIPESMTVEFVDIRKSMEMQGSNPPPVALGDTIAVLTDEGKLFNLNCVELAYDALREETKKIIIGRKQKTIIDTIGSIEQ